MTVVVAAIERPILNVTRVQQHHPQPSSATSCTGDTRCTTGIEFHNLSTQLCSIYTSMVQ